MNPETIAYLNQLNRDFYAAVAHDFDQTRRCAWPGWQRLVPYLTAPLSVLDVGCGNARFALFLYEQLSGTNRLTAHSQPLTALSYHGVDSSAALLAHARESLTGKSGLTFVLEQRDILENPPDADEYDLVVLLGVLHHIPGYEQRQRVMQRLAARVKPGGLLVFTAWRFYEYERFRERIAAWSPDVQVEANDYLLDWRRGTVSLRYCHYTNDAEHKALIATTGLSVVDDFRADGQDGAANRYSVLRK